VIPAAFAFLTISLGDMLVGNDRTNCAFERGWKAGALGLASAVLAAAVPVTLFGAGAFLFEGLRNRLRTRETLALLVFSPRALACATT
jgi:hypothetical protein